MQLKVVQVRQGRTITLLITILQYMGLVETINFFIPKPNNGIC
jgi:hypothetical protein